MRLIFLITISLFSQTAFSIEIPDECRVGNIEPGYCTWVSLQTLALLHGVKELHTILDERVKNSVEYYTDDKGKVVEYPSNIGYDYFVKRKLSALGVNYINQNHGVYKRDLLVKYADKCGCVVTIADKVGDSEWSHSIIITSYSTTRVKYYDSNNPKVIYTVSMSWFDKYWAGNTIVLFKNLPDDFISIK